MIPPGDRHDLYLWADFRRRSLADRSGTVGAGTLTGTAEYGEGPAGEGIALAASSYVTWPETNVGGGSSLTAELWVRLAALPGGGSQSILDETGGPDVTIAVTTAGLVTATTAHGTVTSIEPLVLDRWHHVRLVTTASATSQLWLDGVKVGSAAAGAGTFSTLTVVAGDTAPPAQPVAMDLAELRVYGAAHTTDHLPTALLPEDRACRAIYTDHELVAAEYVTGATWTEVTCAALGWGVDPPSSYKVYRMDLSALSLWGAGFGVEPIDVVGVRGQITVDAAVRECTEVGAPYDLRLVDPAPNNTYCVDLADGYLWMSMLNTVPAPDVGLIPGDFVADGFLEVRVRHRVSTRGRVVGGRWYAPVVLTAGGGRLTAPEWFAPYPTGGGGSFQLARQAPDYSTALLWEEASDVSLVGGAVESYLGGRHTGMVSRVQAFTGRVQAVEQSPDVVTVSYGAPYSRFDRVTFGQGSGSGTGVVTRDEYPTAPDTSVGYVYPQIWGYQSRWVPAPAVVLPEPIEDPSYGRLWPTGSSISLRFTDHPVAAIDMSAYGYDAWADPSIDLDTATASLTVSTRWPLPGVTADPAWFEGTQGHVTGYAANPDAPAAYLAVGDPEDAARSPMAILQAALQYYSDLTSDEATGDASWADTDARVTMLMRSHTTTLQLVEVLERILATTLTCLYARTNGRFGWKDFDSSHTSQATIIDADVVAGQYGHDTRLLSRAIMLQSQYERMAAWYDVGYGDTIERKAYVRQLHPADKYGRLPPRFAPGETTAAGVIWLYRDDEITAWLDSITPTLENPMPTWRGEVVARLDELELMDVVTMATSDLPGAATARFRVVDRQPTARGTLALELRGEASRALPTAITHDRPAFMPIIVTQETSSVAVGVGQTNLYLAGALFDGAPNQNPATYWSRFPAGTTHELIVYGNKTGAGTATVRLQDVTNAQTLGTITLGAGSTFYTTTTVTNIPSGLAVLEWQATTDGATSASVSSMAWVAKEVTPDEITAISATTIAGYYNAAPTARSLSTTNTPDYNGFLWTAGMLGSLPPGAKIQCALDVDVTSLVGGGDVTFRLMYGPLGVVLAEWTPISATGRVRVRAVGVDPALFASYQSVLLVYTQRSTGTGSCLIYGVTITMQAPPIGSL